MTVDDFERIVLKLANQTPTRFWRHWNYPQDAPRVMAVEFDAGGGRIVAELAAKGIRKSDRPGPHGMDLFTVDRTEA